MISILFKKLILKKIFILIDKYLKMANTDTISDTEKYLEIAKQFMPDIPVDFEILKEALIFSNTKQYIISEKYPNLTWCGYELNKSEEESDNFADGSSTTDSATLDAYTYWLLDGLHILCKATKNYSYDCHGHSGGVEMANLDFQEVVLIDWKENRDLKVKEKNLSVDILRMINDITLHICSSQYDEEHIEFYESDIPDAQYVKKVREIMN